VTALGVDGLLKLPVAGLRPSEDIGHAACESSYSPRLNVVVATVGRVA